MIVEDPNLPDNEIRIVVGPTQAKCLAETTRPTAQSIIRVFGITSVRPHRFNPGERLQRPKEDAGSDTNRLTHHVRQVVDPV